MKQEEIARGNRNSTYETNPLDRILNFPYQGKIIEELRNNNKFDIRNRAKFTSPDGELSYNIALVIRKSLLGHLWQGDSGFYIEQKYKNKTLYDFIPLSPKFSISESEGEKEFYDKYSTFDIWSFLKQYAQQKVKNYHISGNKDVEYLNSKQKEIANVTPKEIFSSGGQLNKRYTLKDLFK